MVFWALLMERCWASVLQTKNSTPFNSRAIMLFTGVKEGEEEYVRRIHVT